MIFETERLTDPALRFLVDGSEELRTEFARHARRIRLSEGTSIAWEGDRCEQLAIILDGVVRVYKIGETGREITLYRIERSESCVLTASCILSRSTFPALAVTESSVDAILVPAHVIRQWLARFEPWRDYLFGLLAHRLADVIATVEEVAFRRMDARVAAYLAALGEDGTVVQITHQQIASELGTAREVVSRILKDLERAGQIELSRGTIRLVDRDGLRLREQV